MSLTVERIPLTLLRMAWRWTASFGKKHGTIWLLLVLACNLHGQQHEFNYRLGLHGGALTYYGDLSHAWLDPQPQWLHPASNFPDLLALGLSVEKRLGPSLGAGLAYRQGRFQAADRTIDWKGDPDPENPLYARALNVQTKLRSLSLFLHLYTDNGRMLPERSLLAPFFTLAAGLTHFRPRADLYYGPSNQDRYYYWDDGSLRDQPQDEPGAAIIERDHIYETNLDDLQVEGVNYLPYALSLGGGAGLKVNFGRVNLNLEATLYWTNTDYLDDLSNTPYRSDYDSPAQAYAANPSGIDREVRGDPNGRNDLFAVAGLSLHYNFGARSQKLDIPSIAVGALGPRPAPPDTLGPGWMSDPGLPAAGERPYARADSLQARVTELERQLRGYRAYGDSLAADSLRLAADSLLQLADRLYPSDAARQERRRANDRPQPDTLRPRLLVSGQELVSEASLEALREEVERLAAYVFDLRLQPSTPDIPEDLPTEQQVERHRAELERIEEELERQGRRDDELSPEAEAALDDVEDELEAYRKSIDRLRRTDRNDPAYEALQREVNQLRRRLNVTTGVGVTAGLAATLTNGSRRNRRAIEAVQAQLDSLQLRVSEWAAASSARTSLAPLAQARDATLLNQQDSILLLLADQQQALEQVEAQLAFFQREMDSMAEASSPSSATGRAAPAPVLDHTWAVFFRVGSAKLDVSAQHTLQTAARLAGAYPELTLHLAGFTDSSGSLQTNRQLARRRTQVVSAYLQRLGLDPARIAVDPQGIDEDSFDPAYSRRVEVGLRK